MPGNGEHIPCDLERHIENCCYAENKQRSVNQTDTVYGNVENVSCSFGRKTVIIKEVIFITVRYVMKTYFVWKFARATVLHD